MAQPRYDDIEREELLRAAAMIASSQEPPSFGPEQAWLQPGAMIPAGVNARIAPPTPPDSVLEQGYAADDGSVPPEVFRELRKRFRSMPPGPEKNYGVVSMEGPDGKTYQYDKYAKFERQGYMPDRTKGPVANYFLRLGQEWTGMRKEEVERRQADDAARMKDREFQADESWRRAQVDRWEADDRRAEADQKIRRGQFEAGMWSEAADRAARRWEEMYENPTEKAQREANEALAEQRRSQSDFLQKQRESIEKGTGRYGDKGGPGKPAFTPDQAWNNLRDAERELRAIRQERQAIRDAHKGGWGNFLPGGKPFNDIDPSKNPEMARDVKMPDGQILAAQEVPIYL